MLKKRIFDIIFSSIGLILLAPLFIVIAVFIKADSNGEVFFRQIRVGKNEVPFKIYKFRTMSSKQKGNESKITVGNDSRITDIGKILRKYKIDELPQLINILKSEMSFVGPRPEVPEYVKYYSKQSRDIVLSVRPGITDIASIEFKDENAILANKADPENAYIEKILPKKLRYCRFYVKNQSLCYDILIVFKTLQAIFCK